MRLSSLSGIMASGLLACTSVSRDDVAQYLQERKPMYALLAVSSPDYPLPVTLTKHSDSPIPVTLAKHKVAVPAPLMVSASLAQFIQRLEDQGVRVSLKGVFKNTYAATLLVPPWEHVPASFDCFYDMQLAATPEQIRSILNIESIYRRQGKDVCSYTVSSDERGLHLERLVGER